MGAGIAQVAALAGHPVRLVDNRHGVAAAAVTKIGETLLQLASKKKLDGAKAADAASRITAVEQIDDLADAGLIIEAIVENLEVKRQLLSQLEAVVSDDCILATNTSSLSVTAIAARMRAPQRVVGMHFFNPAPLMALVEVVSGLATDPQVLETLTATAVAWGKVPVQAKSTPGFIVNRCARPYYAEGLRLLLERAADCATIDAVMRESGGFRMGPFELMDLIGHDVNYAVTKSVFDASYGDPRYTPSLAQLELVHAGFLGRKSGRGFYQYGEAPLPKPATEGSISGPLPPIAIYGRSDLAQALVARLEAAKIFHLYNPNAGDDGVVAKVEDTVLFLTDGRTATQRSLDLGRNNLVLVDLALDFRKASRVALAKSDLCSGDGFKGVVAVMQSAGYDVSRLEDVPGLAVMRTVAMLANEAAEAVNHGVCSAAAADLAMLKGVNYPRGPLDWADAVGLSVIAKVLLNLSECYGEDRYRLSTLLRRCASSGRRLSAEHA